MDMQQLKLDVPVVPLEGLALLPNRLGVILRIPVAAEHKESWKRLLCDLGVSEGDQVCSACTVHHNKHSCQQECCLHLNASIRDMQPRCTPVEGTSESCRQELMISEMTRTLQSC